MCFCLEELFHSTNVCFFNFLLLKYNTFKIKNSTFIIIYIYIYIYTSLDF